MSWYLVSIVSQARYLRAFAYMYVIWKGLKYKHVSLTDPCTINCYCMLPERTGRWLRRWGFYMQKAVSPEFAWFVSPSLNFFLDFILASSSTICTVGVVSFFYSRAFTCYIFRLVIVLCYLKLVCRHLASTSGQTHHFYFPTVSKNLNEIFTNQVPTNSVRLLG